MGFRRGARISIKQLRYTLTELGDVFVGAILGVMRPKDTMETMDQRCRNVGKLPSYFPNDTVVDKQNQ